MILTGCTFWAICLTFLGGMFSQLNLSLTPRKRGKKRSGTIPCSFPREPSGSQSPARWEISTKYKASLDDRHPMRGQTFHLETTKNTARCNMIWFAFWKSSLAFIIDHELKWGFPIGRGWVRVLVLFPKREITVSVPMRVQALVGPVWVRWSLLPQYAMAQTTGPHSYRMASVETTRLGWHEAPQRKGLPTLKDKPDARPIGGRHPVWVAGGGVSLTTKRAFTSASPEME